MKHHHQVLSSVFILTLILSIAAVFGHGYASGPFKARNVVHSNDCPQCANGPSPCGGGGGQWEESTDVDLVDGKWTVKPLPLVKAGEVFQLDVRVTAAHKGHFVLDLCRPTGDRITHECFSTRLKRDQTDSRYGPFLPSDPHAFFFTENVCATKELQRARFIMPADIAACDHCILRWYWQTANSCSSHPGSGPNPATEITSWSRGDCVAAISDGTSCGVNCPTPSCSNEQFKNCMDIKIMPHGGGGSPAPTTTKPTGPTTMSSSSSSSPASSSSGVGVWPGCSQSKPNPGSGLTDFHCEAFCRQIVNEENGVAVGTWPGCGLGSTDPDLLKKCLEQFNCHFE